MNLLGKAFKLIGWVAFGKHSATVKKKIIDAVINSTRISIKKDGVYIEFKKEI